MYSEKCALDWLKVIENLCKQDGTCESMRGRENCNERVV